MDRFREKYPDEKFQLALAFNNISDLFYRHNFDLAWRFLNRGLLLLALILTTSPAIAELVPGWFDKAIKSDNPDELAYALLVSRRPFAQEKARGILEGVFIRLTPKRKDEMQAKA